MTRILVLGDILAAGLEVLKSERGFEVQEISHDDPAPIREALLTADVLIVHSKISVTADLLEQSPSLKVISRSGASLSTIDMNAATRRGVIVMSTPVGDSVSVAEHTIGLMLSILRRIPQADRSLRGGEWEGGKYIGVELHQKTLGVIGYGKIGAEVVKRALSFGMKVLIVQPVRRRKAGAGCGHTPCQIRRASRPLGCGHAPYAPHVFHSQTHRL